MAKYLNSFALLLLYACNTGVDILTPNFQSAPIIYGVTDPFDSVQSVRIQRSFLIRDKNGALLQDPDSLYYDSVQVYLGGLLKDQETWRIELKRTSVEKNIGSFTGANHHIYKHTGKLPVQLKNESSDYPGTPDIEEISLTINILDINKSYYSKSPVFSPVMVLNNGRHSKSISLYGTNVTVFILYAACGLPGVLYEGNEIRFRAGILEYSDSGVYPKTVEWFTSQGFLNGYEMTPERFYNRLMMGLDLSDSIEVRVLEDIEVEMTVAAKSFGEYFYQSQWDGMVDIPFTNIPGAMGVFTTKSKGKLTGLSLDKRSLDSLCYGQKWKHLKFAHW